MRAWRVIFSSAADLQYLLAWLVEHKCDFEIHAMILSCLTITCCSISRDAAANRVACLGQAPKNFNN
jgi:hypothetical protein